MQTEIDDLKKRLRSLESKLEQNKIEWTKERERHREVLAGKVKEESLLKSEIQQLSDLLRDSKGKSFFTGGKTFFPKFGHSASCQKIMESYPRICFTSTETLTRPLLLNRFYATPIIRPCSKFQN